METVLIFYSRCARCRSSAKTSQSLQSLPCGHSYCDDCLRNLYLSAIENAKVFPLTCCKTPLPSGLVKDLLSREEQSRFVGMILRIDRDRGWQASCSRCRSYMEGKDSLESDRILGGQCATCIMNFCKTCISEVHPSGQACPAVSKEMLVLETFEETDRLVIGLGTRCLAAIR